MLLVIGHKINWYGFEFEVMAIPNTFGFKHVKLKFIDTEFWITQNMLIAGYLKNKNMSTDKNPDYVEKPPLGIIPKWRYDELRMEGLRDAIERYKSAHREVPEEWTSELTSLEVFAKDVLEHQEISQREKIKDWMYILKSAIYTTLISYSDSNGYTIPCKVRKQYEETILKKFIDGLVYDNYQTPIKRT